MGGGDAQVKTNGNLGWGGEEKKDPVF